MCAKLKGFVPLRRLGAFLSALSLCFVLTVPVLAADGSNPDVAAELTWVSAAYPTISGGPGFHYRSRQKSVAAPFYGSNSPFDSYSSPSLSSPALRIFCMPTRFELSSADWFSGAIGLYVSFYAVVGDGNISGSWGTPLLSSCFNMFYIDHLGNEHIGDLTIDTFTPAVSGSSVSPGYTIKASLLAEQASPVSAVGFSSVDLNLLYNRFSPTAGLLPISTE